MEAETFGKTGQKLRPKEADKTALKMGSKFLPVPTFLTFESAFLQQVTSATGTKLLFGVVLCILVVSDRLSSDTIVSFTAKHFLNSLVVLSLHPEQYSECNVLVN